MAEMPPENPPAQGGGGNVLTQRYMGVPGLVWMAGAAILAYFLFFRNKSSSGAGGTSSGGGGTSTTGDVALTPGTTTIDLSGQTAPVNTPQGGTSPDTDNNGINPGGPGQTGTPNPQPTPTPPPRTVGTHTSVNFTNYTVQAGDTLASVAKKFGITVATLAHANVYVAGEVPGNKKVGQRLGTGAGLKTGQVLRIPHVKTTTSG